MKFKFWKKYGIALLLAFTMLLQLISPIISDYTYAEKDESLDITEEELEESEETVENKTDKESENNDLEEDNKDKDLEDNTDEEEKLDDQADENIKESDKSESQLFSDNERNLEEESGFHYTTNIYTEFSEEPLENGDTIDIENISLLGYDVKFNIDNGFNFVNGDYLNIDILDLANLPELDLNGLSGRIEFDIGGNKVDAAKYEIIEGVLKVTFDNGEALNNANNREGWLGLDFNIKKSTADLPTEEEIKIGGKEPKTFTIIRNNPDGVDIKKSGEYNENNDNIVWTIDINITLKDLVNTRLLDILPEGLSVEKLEIADLKVTTKNINSGSYSDKNYTVDGNEVNIELGNLKRQAKRIKITTSIDSSVGGQAVLENKGRLISDGVNPKEDTATVELDRFTGISKSVREEGNLIHWTIEFQGDSNDGTSNIVDTLTVPKEILMGLLNEEITLNDEPFDSKNVEYDIDTKRITFKNVPNSTLKQTIKYTTTTFYQGESITGETLTLNNKAIHNGKSAEASISVDRLTAVYKDDGKVYQENGETYIDWVIDLNPNDECWTDVILKEYLPEGFELVEITKDGQVIDSDKIKDKTDYLEISLGKLEKRTYIVVSTKVVDPSTFDNISNIKNRASAEWSLCGTGVGIEERRFSEEYSGNFDKTELNHSLKKEGKGINYKEEKAEWKLTYKTYTNTIKTGFRIEDTLSGDGEQQYLKDSLQLKLNTTNYANLKEGANQKAGTGDSTITYDLEFSNDDKSFTLTIKDGKINDFANELKLKYSTKFDLSKMEDVEDKNQLKNSVNIDNDGKELDDSSSQSLRKRVSKNLKKEVSEVSGENRVFNWKVELNYKGKDIDDNTEILDTLSAGHEYIEDSIKTYKASILDNGNLNRESEINSFETTINDNNNRMNITFTEDINHPVIVEYQTKGIGISQEKYSNNVEYNGMTDKATTGHEQDTFIEKTLLNDKNGKVVKGDILRWEVEINKDLSEIYDFTLTDTMSSGLAFIKDSLKVYDGTIDVTSEFTLSDLDNNEKGFALSKDKVNKHYTIKYETLVTGNKGEVVSNDAKLTGIGIEKPAEKKEYEVVERRGGAGGSGDLEENEYQITIVKVDTNEDPITNNPAKFKLTTETKFGNEIIESEEELETDNNGHIVIVLENNDYNSYFLEEIEAPSGYRLNNERIKIDFSNANNEKEIVIEVTNELEEDLIEITARKLWIGLEPGTTPPTIELQLYRDDEAYGNSVELTNGETSYTWEGLEKADISGKEYVYTVDELEIPEGYSKTVDGFTITNTKKSDPTDPTDPVEKTYAIGDKVWMDSNKNGIQDEDEKGLPGVKVELYDERGKIAETTTDANGCYLFDNLKEGDYRIKFTLTDEQAEIYEFTKQNEGNDGTVDSDVSKDGWTVEFRLDGSNNNLTDKVVCQPYEATEGINPTWDAGVVKKEKPVDPTDPTDPTEPTDPTDPTEPTDPVDPTDPKPDPDPRPDPGPGLVDPADPEKPSQPDTSVSEGRIRIIKRSGNTQELLQGAKFNLVNDAGRIVDILITDNQGKAVSKYLPIGQYTIEEIEAPEGYVSEKKDYKIRVYKDLIEEIVIYNNLEKTDEIDKPEDPNKPKEEESTDKPPESGSEAGGRDDKEETDKDTGNASDKTPTKQEGSKKISEERDKSENKPKLPKTGFNDNISMIIYLLGAVFLILGFSLMKKQKE